MVAGTNIGGGMAGKSNVIAIVIVIIGIVIAIVIVISFGMTANVSVAGLCAIAASWLSSGHGVTMVVSAARTTWSSDTCREALM
jgi:hypothetical protein